MLLNSNQISNYLIESEFSKRNQVGIDLSVSKIEEILDLAVTVFKNETSVNKSRFKEVHLHETENFIGWVLPPGTYALTFNEKVNIPSSVTGFILSRSSIYRGGSFICSPIWDPGFTTGDNFMGTTMIVTKAIRIEKDARVAQFFMHDNYFPGETYSGQFQGKTNY